VPSLLASRDRLLFRTLSFTASGLTGWLSSPVAAAACGFLFLRPRNQQLAAVSRASGNLDVFVIGFDNHVWTTWWNDHDGWGTGPDGHLFPIGLPSGPAPVERAPGKIIVYGLTPHHAQATVGASVRKPRWSISELLERLGHRGVLATPLGDEFELGDQRGGRRRDFMGAVTSRRQRVSVRMGPELSTPTFQRPQARVHVTASVLWSPETGAHVVMGDIREAYLRYGGPTGQLGYPIANESDTTDCRGRVSRFEHGAIVWQATTGAEIRPRTSLTDTL
jgi:hypothetical protein